MPRLLPLLLLCLTLLTAACKKDSAGPKPTLQGQWTEHSHKGYTYDKGGKLLKEISYVPPTPTYGMIIHSTTYERRFVMPDGTWGTTFTESYTRKGDIIHFDRGPGYDFDLRIMELTEHTLLLRYERPITDPTTGEYETWDDTFSR